MYNLVVTVAGIKGQTCTAHKWDWTKGGEGTGSET